MEKGRWRWTSFLPILFYVCVCLSVGHRSVIINLTRYYPNCHELWRLSFVLTDSPDLWLKLYFAVASDFLTDTVSNLKNLLIVDPGWWAGDMGDTYSQHQPGKCQSVSINRVSAKVLFVTREISHCCVGLCFRQFDRSCLCISFNHTAEW